MAFQGADVSALNGVAGACQKGAAAAGIVIKILKQVIAALRASASGPWVEPFIRSLEALIKVLEMIVQRLDEFAKLLSANAAQQVRASTPGGSATSPAATPVSTAKPLNSDPAKSITDAVNAVSGLLDKLDKPAAAPTGTAADSAGTSSVDPVSAPGGKSADCSTADPVSGSTGSSADNPAGHSGGGSPGARPMSSSSGGGSSAGTHPASPSTSGSTGVLASSLDRGATTNYAANGTLSPAASIPLGDKGNGSVLSSVVGAGSVLGGLGVAGRQFLRGRENSDETTRTTE